MLGDITVQKYALDRSLRDRKRKIRWEMVPKGIEGWHCWGILQPKKRADFTPLGVSLLQKIIKPSITVWFLTVSTNAYLTSCSSAFQFSYFLAQYQYFVCPVEYKSETNRFVTECEPLELFQMKKYSVPLLLRAVLGWVRKKKHKVLIKIGIIIPSLKTFIKTF